MSGDEARTFISKERNGDFDRPGTAIDKVSIEQETMLVRRRTGEGEEMHKIEELAMGVADDVACYTLLERNVD